MIRTRERVSSVVLFALCVTAPALPATSSNFQAAIESPAAPIGRANPLWAVPLSALTATRERPLFSPSRRPPAPVIVTAPVAPPTRPPPPPAPEHPNLVLVGTARERTHGIAVFVDSTTQAMVRLQTGEGHMGWILQSVDRNAVELQKGDQTETLELAAAGAQNAQAPVVNTAAAPPPAPPPPPPPPPPHHRPPTNAGAPPPS